jgi:hypothetical protein
MAKFAVGLKRDMADSESAVAIVEAETEEGAMDIALNQVDRERLTWRRNNDFESETVVESIMAAEDGDETSGLDGDANVLPPVL